MSVEEISQEEFRRDMMEDDRDAYNHEVSMLVDRSYFKMMSNYNRLLEEMRLMQNTCNMYDVDFMDVLESLREEV